MKKFAPYVLKLADLVEQSSDGRRSFNPASIARRSMVSHLECFEIWLISTGAESTGLSSPDRT